MSEAGKNTSKQHVVRCQQRPDIQLRIFESITSHPFETPILFARLELCGQDGTVLDSQELVKVPKTPESRKLLKKLAEEKFGLSSETEVSTWTLASLIEPFVFVTYPETVFSSVIEIFKVSDTLEPVLKRRYQTLDIVSPELIQIYTENSVTALDRATLIDLTPVQQERLKAQTSRTGFELSSKFASTLTTLSLSANNVSVTDVSRRLFDPVTFHRLYTKAIDASQRYTSPAPHLSLSELAEFFDLKQQLEERYENRREFLTDLAAALTVSKNLGFHGEDVRRLVEEQLNSTEFCELIDTGALDAESLRLLVENRLETKTRLAKKV